MTNSKHIILYLVIEEIESGTLSKTEVARRLADLHGLRSVTSHLYYIQALIDIQWLAEEYNDDGRVTILRLTDYGKRMLSLMKHRL